VRDLIHILTMVAFAVHAVVGCCLHHHHEANSAISVDDPDILSVRCRHHCAHHEDSRPVGDSHQERPSNDEPPCHESTCAFQAERLIRMNEILGSFQSDTFSLALPIPSLTSDAVAGFPRTPGTTEFLHTDAQSLRASLQVWLI